MQICAIVPAVVIPTSSDQTPCTPWMRLTSGKFPGKTKICWFVFFQVSHFFVGCPPGRNVTVEM